MKSEQSPPTNSSLLKNDPKIVQTKDKTPPLPSVAMKNAIKVP